MATGVMIAGTALSTYSMYRAGQDQRDIANRNAEALNQTASDNERIAAENLAIANREADTLLQTGETAVSTKRKEIARLLAYQRVQEAVSGFAYEGTPLLVAEESAREGEEDVATIWSNAVKASDEIRAKGKVAAEQGTLISGQLRTQADIARTGGSYAANVGSLGAASTLLQGISNTYMYSKYPNMRIG